MVGRTIGVIEPYVETEKDFESYAERVKLYFTANGVDEDKQVASFLTVCAALHMLR